MISDPNRIETGAVSERGRIEQPSRPAEHREAKISSEVIAATSATTALIGGGAAALAIIGLAGALPTFLGPIAAIALGGALMIEAAGVAARYRHLVHETYGREGSGLTLGGGMGVEFIGGAAAVALGILALVRVEPIILLACAVIALGATLLMGTGAMVRLNHFIIEHSDAHSRSQEAARQAVSASADAQALVGVGAIVLGILALIGLAPVVLNLVGLLSIGAALLLSGSALTGRMASIFSR